MLVSQALEIRGSEIRSRLNELSGTETLTDEHRAEIDGLTVEYRDSESKRRAAIVAEDFEAAQAATGDGQHVDAETRERLELRGKSKVTNYLLAHLKGRHVDGADAEFAAACGAGGDIPLEIFESEVQRSPEERAVTTAPGTVGVNMAPIQPAVFAPSIAAFMGIDMPQVQTGTFGQARISTSLRAGAKAKGSGAAASEASFTVATATPKRISARLDFQAEDVAAAGVSNFEAALRQNLQMALSAELDEELITGDGSGAHLIGLIKALADPAADTTTLSFDHGLDKLADLIDGALGDSDGTHSAGRGRRYVPEGREVCQCSSDRREGRDDPGRLPAKPLGRLPDEQPDARDGCDEAERDRVPGWNHGDAHCSFPALGQAVD